MIYCVEDDKNIQRIEVYKLNSMGFDAKGCDNAEDLFAAIEVEFPRLIILDIMLEGKDGMEILNELKNNPKTKDVPVIMATAKGDELDKIRALDLGADDYLVKPISMLEMVSRVKAVLRRYEPQQDEAVNVFKYKNIEVDLKGYTVKVDGVDVELTFKEYQLLVALLKKPGVVLSRQQLLNDIWNITYEGASRTVDVHIGTLRHKLKDAGKYIITKRNIGYKVEKE